MKKLLSTLLCTILCVGTVLGLAGCGQDTGKSTAGTASAPAASGTAAAQSTQAEEGEEKSTPVSLDMSKKVKMGVLVSDATSAEALAFRTYYTDYIQKQYNVELLYSDELADAAGEKGAIETFITNNCKAIISFSSFDRAAQIEQCQAASVYYAVATGTLTAEEYEKYKEYSYYVGAVGPSLDVEFQAGYDMAKNYLDNGSRSFAIFGGALPYYTEMHIYRVAGMLTAMVDAGGEGASYLGATDKEGIVAQIFTDGSVTPGTIGDVSLLGYVGGYDMDEAWFAKCAQTAQLPGLEVLLAVGNGSDFFGTAVAGTDVKIASVDAYASSFGEAMNAGMLDYLAGKFSASIGPIFIATYRAALGAPVRTPEGSALALDQGYWVAASYEEFQKYYAVDSSMEAPAYTKAILDTLLEADYDTFSSFVSRYSFEEIQALAK